MSEILRKVQQKGICSFTSLFNPEEGVSHVVVNFIALLELIKEGLLHAVQNHTFGEIEIKALECA